MSLSSLFSLFIWGWSCHLTIRWLHRSFIFTDLRSVYWSVSTGSSVLHYNTVLHLYCTVSMKWAGLYSNPVRSQRPGLVRWNQGKVRAAQTSQKWCSFSCKSFNSITFPRCPCTEGYAHWICLEQESTPPSIWNHFDSPLPPEVQRGITTQDELELFW